MGRNIEWGSRLWSRAEVSTLSPPPPTTYVNPYPARGLPFVRLLYLGTMTVTYRPLPNSVSGIGRKFGDWISLSSVGWYKPSMVERHRGVEGRLFRYGGGVSLGVMSYLTFVRKRRSQVPIFSVGNEIDKNLETPFYSTKTGLFLPFNPPLTWYTYELKVVDNVKVSVISKTIKSLYFYTITC